MMTMHETSRRSPFPLYAQVLVAVLCGATLGILFGQEPYLGGLRNEQLGQLGLWVVWMLKTLAIPLIFFAILDALLRTSIPLSQGTKLLVICLVNVSVAMAIGLAIMNLWQPGLAWLGHVDELLHLVPGSTLSSAALANVQAGSQSPIEYLASYIPRTLTNPFSSNNIIGVVLLALLLGGTLRYLHGQSDQTGGLVAVVHGASNGSMVGSCRSLNGLSWRSHSPSSASSHMSLASPAWASSPSSGSFSWPCSPALRSIPFLYYPLVAWLVGKKSPKKYLGQGADAIMTAVSCNSSLATVPVTLRCLERMQVSAQSARLAACVGTNFNNGGVALYEAMAALFLAQALGDDLPMAKQVLIVLASIIAGAGVAGIPEAGLIVCRWSGRCRITGSRHPCRHSPHHDRGLDHRPRPLRRERHERHARRHPARCRADDTGNRGMMALTREFKDTVVTRVQRDPGFGKRSSPKP